MCTSDNQAKSKHLFELVLGTQNDLKKHKADAADNLVDKELSDSCTAMWK